MRYFDINPWHFLFCGRDHSWFNMGITRGPGSFAVLGPVSRKCRELFGPEKKLRPAYSIKLVFSYVVKGIKIKITAKFRASRLSTPVLFRT